MNTLIESFLQYQKHERNASDHTIDAYQRELKHFLNYLSQVCGFDLDFSAASPPYDPVWPDYDTLRGFVYFLSNKQYTKRSIAHHIAVIKSFHNFLIRKELLNKNVAALLRTPKFSKKLPGSLPENEMAELLDTDWLSLNAKNNKENPVDDYQYLLFRVVIEMLYGSGIRISELTGLDLNKVQTDMIKVFGKGKKERIVFIGDVAKKILAEYMSQREAILKKRNKQTNKLLISHHGNAMSPRMVRALLEKVRKQIGFDKKIHPHLFRHSFATHLLNNGCSIRAVQEFLGHSSLQATQVYLHISKQRLQDIYRNCHPHGK